MKKINAKSSRDYMKFALVAVLAVMGSALFAQNLTPKVPVVTDLSGNPTTITTPGQEFLFTIPLMNSTPATQTNVLGVAVPVSDPITMINPLSVYGDIADGVTTSGSPFRGKLDAATSPTRYYYVKMGVKSDQEQFERVYRLAGNTGSGGPHVAQWPPVNYGSATGTVKEPAAWNANEVIVNSTEGLLGGAVYVNLRTGEIIAIHSVEPATNKIRVRRGQFGTVPPSDLQPGDTLAYEGVIIPDAVNAGVALKCPVEPVPGAIGNLKLWIEDIVHPRVGDLLLTLECEGTVDNVKHTTSVVLLEPIAGGLSNGSNITDVTFADGGTSTTGLTGTLTPGVTYAPAEPLSTFSEIDGANITGWTLRVSDIISPASGYVRGGWTLDF